MLVRMRGRGQGRADSWSSLASHSSQSANSKFGKQPCLKKMMKNARRCLTSTFDPPPNMYIHRDTDTHKAKQDLEGPGFNFHHWVGNNNKMKPKQTKRQINSKNAEVWLIHYGFAYQPPDMCCLSFTSPALSLVFPACSRHSCQLNNKCMTT